MSKFQQFHDDLTVNEIEYYKNGKNNIINLIDRLEELGIPSPKNKKSNNDNYNYDNSSIFSKRTQKSYNKSPKANVNIKIPDEDFNNYNNTSYNDDVISKSIKQQKPTKNYSLINLEINLNIDKENHIRQLAQKLQKIENTEGNISTFNDTSNNMLTNPFDIYKININSPKNFEQLQNFSNYNSKDIDLNTAQNKNEVNNEKNKNDNKKKKQIKKLGDSNKFFFSNTIKLKNSSFMGKNKSKKNIVKKKHSFIFKMKCQCPNINFLNLFKNACIIFIIISAFVIYCLTLFRD